MLSETRVAVSSAAATQSMRAACAGRSWSASAHHEAASPAIASGMLSQNCHSHERKRTSIAPYSGPHTHPIVSIAPSVPSARARLPSG